MVADVAPLGFDDGAAFCWRLPELIGVAAVPVSVFCADPELGRTLVRFAFCKRDEVLGGGGRAAGGAEGALIRESMRTSGVCARLEDLRAS